jgi:N-acyl amino acid synthase of PEP-CTERM/exosortase system
MNTTKTGKIVNSLRKVVGSNNRLGKLLDGYCKLQEANFISSHFSSYLTPLLATEAALQQQVYKIRYNVYCQELKFEEPNPLEEERDEFDDYSQHCLIHHDNSSLYAGTVRIVTPTEPTQLLPIEKYCINSITNKQFDPRQFDRKDVCEVSRLAVPSMFRRRQMDKFQGAGVGVINQSTYSETELRCFPFIAVGLYLAAASMALESQIKHAYVMMEPRLARSMSFVGIKFEQIGPVVEYHGKRAPYYINQHLLTTNLTMGFAKMLKDIQNEIRRGYA